MMTCRTCQQERPLDEMSSSFNNRRGKRYYGPDCKPCRSARRRSTDEAARGSARKMDRYRSDPEYRERVLDQQRLSRMGITRERFDAIMHAQGGGCVICGTQKPDGNGWHLDHDHGCCPPVASGCRRSCGECIRGITCNRCNLAMGRLRDDPELCLKMYAYLQRTAA